MRLGLFGLPGAGKGTQALRIAKHCGIPHISTGEMFRDLQKGTSPLAQEIRGILASGALVSDEMVTELVFERLSRKDCEHGFVLDGYPRTLAQATALQKSIFSLDALISIEVSHSEIVKRLSERRVCEQCNSVFSEKDARCQYDGTPLTQRADDMPEAIVTRLRVFEQKSLAVIEFFKLSSRLHYVDGNGSTELVFKRILQLIAEIKQNFERDK